MADGGPRRQVRGIRRIELILDTAEALFAEVGYDATTTNAIAAAAAISPGSLYQFFPNKLAIAEALTARYVAGLDDVYGRILAASPGGAQVPALIDQLVEALVTFNAASPGARALMAGAEVSPDLVTVVAPLHAAMCDRAEDIVGATAPTLTAGQRKRTADVCIHVVRALMPAIVAAPPAERADAATELKRVLVGYLSTPR
jgi:AcrR family transcriptional regulator